MKGEKTGRSCRSFSTFTRTRSLPGRLRLRQGYSVSGGAHPEVAPAVNSKALHAKTGELALESDFLAGALSRAGIPNAKR